LEKKGVSDFASRKGMIDENGLHVGFSAVFGQIKAFWVTARRAGLFSPFEARRELHIIRTGVG